MNNTDVYQVGTYDDASASKTFPVNYRAGGRLFIKHHNNKGLYTPDISIEYYRFYKISLVFNLGVSKELFIDDKKITLTQIDSNNEDTNLAINLDNIQLSFVYEIH